MIIIFDKASGKLMQLQIGTCLNANTFKTDGFLNILPGGRYDNPPADQGIFNFDENIDPALGDELARAIYSESGRYYVSDIDGVMSIVESV